MTARVRLLGHPLHRILGMFPLGLLATSFFFDLAWLAHGRETLAISAHRIVLAGVAGATIAAAVGIADWIALPRGSSPWKFGMLHGAGNAVVVLLFTASWLLRRAAPWHPSALEISLSGAGVLLIVVTAWLGGEIARRSDAYSK